MDSSKPKICLSSLFDLFFLKKRKNASPPYAPSTNKRPRERSPRPFVVDFPDDSESAFRGRVPVGRARPARPRRMDSYSCESRGRRGPRVVPPETQRSFPPRPPRERSPVSERVPARRGRRVPVRNVEVHNPQPRTERPPILDRESRCERQGPSPGAALPSGKRVRFTNAPSPRGTESQRHPSPPASTPRRYYSSSREVHQVPVKLENRRPRAREADLAPRPASHRLSRPSNMQARHPRIETRAPPKVIQDGRRQISSSAKDMLQDAQFRSNRTTRYAVERVPEPQSRSRRRARWV